MVGGGKIAVVAWWGYGVGGGSEDVGVVGFPVFTRRVWTQIGLASVVLRIERVWTGIEIANFCIYEGENKCTNASIYHPKPNPVISLTL